MIAYVGIGALALSLIGVWAIRRRLLRQTHGLPPDELRVMYEHHDAILHSVSEGLVVLDRDRVVLVNDEARRLLGLAPGRVTQADLPEFLRDYALARATGCTSPTSPTQLIRKWSPSGTVPNYRVRWAN